MTSVPNQFRTYLDVDLNTMTSMTVNLHRLRCETVNVTVCMHTVDGFVCLSRAQGFKYLSCTETQWTRKRQRFSVAEQRQQLSAEYSAWGVTLLECSHA